MESFNVGRAHVAAFVDGGSSEPEATIAIGASEHKGYHEVEIGMPGNATRILLNHAQAREVVAALRARLADPNATAPVVVPPCGSQGTPVADRFWSVEYSEDGHDWADTRYGTRFADLPGAELESGFARALQFARAWENDSHVRIVSHVEMTVAVFDAQHRHQVPACANRDHDHTTVYYDDDGEELDDPIAMLCQHCKQPTHYDQRVDRYEHDDPNAPDCFLIASDPLEQLAGVGSACYVR